MSSSLASITFKYLLIYQIYQIHHSHLPSADDKMIVPKGVTSDSKELCNLFKQYFSSITKTYNNIVFDVTMIQYYKTILYLYHDNIYEREYFLFTRD